MENVFHHAPLQCTTEIKRGIGFENHPVRNLIGSLAEATYLSLSILNVGMELYKHRSYLVFFYQVRTLSPP